jgi:4-hydroxy-2-oxoheptanedioate aldolase
MRTNTTRAKLASGHPVAGLIVPVAAPVLVDLAALAGFDYVLIDTEHGNLGFEAAEHLVRAAEAAGITPLARASHNAPSEILRLLDIGAQGVMVPQVSSAAEAEAAVRAAKFHPRGNRGLAGSRAAGYGLTGSMQDYVAHANRETMVLALIEDIRALDDLDAILAVDGIDVLFIGASDLAQSMGHPGRPDHSEVRAAVDRIIDRCVAAGRVVGVNAGTAEAGAAYRERGVRFFSLGPWHQLVGIWRAYVAAIASQQDGGA